MGKYGRKRDPTPEEIEAACAAIRAGWTDSERRRRAVQPVEAVEVTRTTAGELGDTGGDLAAAG